MKNSSYSDRLKLKEKMEEDEEEEEVKRCALA